MKSYRMTYKILRDYLRRQRKGSIVGYCSDPYHCTVAEAYKEILPQDMWASVGTKYTTIYKNCMYGYTRHTQVKNAKFLQKTIEEMDDTKGVDKPVTREYALKVLEGNYAVRNLTI